MRAYCRECDAAREAEGEWPGRCAACATPVEEHPVPDVVRPRLEVLFVGINPGVQTARARRHFANPRNAFWGALHESGLTPRRFSPDDEDELLALGYGIANAVTRATPGSADVTGEDVRRGRERLERLVEETRPEWLAFVGKQAFKMATSGIRRRRSSPPSPSALAAAGSARSEHGEQPERLWGARAFVLPSTSPANAAVSPGEKLAWFRRLAERASKT